MIIDFLSIVTIIKLFLMSYCLFLLIELYKINKTKTLLLLVAYKIIRIIIWSLIYTNENFIANDYYNLGIIIFKINTILLLIAGVVGLIFTIRILSPKKMKYLLVLSLLVIIPAYTTFTDATINEVKSEGYTFFGLSDLSSTILLISFIMPLSITFLFLRAWRKTEDENFKFGYLCYAVGFGLPLVASILDRITPELIPSLLFRIFGTLGDVIMLIGIRTLVNIRKSEKSTL